MKIFIVVYNDENYTCSIGYLGTSSF